MRFLVQWFLRRRYFETLHPVFTAFCDYLPFKKDFTLYFRFPFSLECFVPSLIKFVPVGLEKNLKMCIYRWTDRWTLGDKKTFSSGEVKLTFFINFIVFIKQKLL